MIGPATSDWTPVVLPVVVVVLPSRTPPPVMLRVNWSRGA
jgi:hypothetical protein